MVPNKPVIAAAAAGIVVVGLGAWWWFSRAPAVPEAPAEIVETPPVETPAIRNPVPAAASDQPLPALADSDEPLFDALAKLVGFDALKQYVIPKDLIRHIVVTVDNLPRKKLAIQLRPVAPIAGQIGTSAVGDTIVLAPANAGRYTPFVTLMQAADTAMVTSVYQRFYPLFQEAYEGLGYPSEYFNDRLVEVIDHLLETPDLTGPIELARPSVMYTFADPALEGLSAGQKTLLRMGTENAAVVKTKLRELRAAVAAQPRN